MQFLYLQLNFRVDFRVLFEKDHYPKPNDGENRIFSDTAQAAGYLIERFNKLYQTNIPTALINVFPSLATNETFKKIGRASISLTSQFGLFNTIEKEISARLNGNDNFNGIGYVSVLDNLGNHLP